MLFNRSNSYCKEGRKGVTKKTPGSSDAPLKKGDNRRKWWHHGNKFTNRDRQKEWDGLCLLKWRHLSLYPCLLFVWVCNPSNTIKQRCGSRSRSGYSGLPGSGYSGLPGSGYSGLPGSGSLVHKQTPVNLFFSSYITLSKIRFLHNYLFIFNFKCNFIFKSGKEIVDFCLCLSVEHYLIRRGYRNLLRGMRDFEKGKLYKKGKKGRLSIKTIFLK